MRRRVFAPRDDVRDRLGAGRRVLARLQAPHGAGEAHEERLATDGVDGGIRDEGARPEAGSVDDGVNGRGGDGVDEVLDGGRERRGEGSAMLGRAEGGGEALEVKEVEGGVDDDGGIGVPRFAAGGEVGGREVVEWLNVRGEPGRVQSGAVLVRPLSISYLLSRLAEEVESTNRSRTGHSKRNDSCIGK